MGLRQISGELIRQSRGDRSIDEIVAGADGKFTRGALSSWENDKYAPRGENTIALVRALGCSYDDISIEMTAQTADQ